MPTAHKLGKKGIPETAKKTNKPIVTQIKADSETAEEKYQITDQYTVDDKGRH